MTDSDQLDIPDDLVEAVRAARDVVVLTGAGVSAESGIPTFRDGLTGFWAEYDPEQLATPEGFARDPELVTRWYDQRRAECAKCKPNPAHVALARWESEMRERSGGGFTLLTQNVDRLHQAAGSRNVVELHGSLWEWRCTKTGHQREYREVPFDDYPPRSEYGGLLRPAVVWFGEALPAKAVAAADQAVSRCDLFASVGTSALVYPAAGYLRVAADLGAATVEINRERTPASDIVNWSILGSAGRVLPRLISRAFGQSPEED